MNLLPARVLLPLATLTLLVGTMIPQPRSRPLPELIKRDGRYALMVDGSPYLELGAQINNSSAFPASMKLVWPTLEALQVNTIEAPVYWETLEPQRGHFDYAQLDMLLDQSRQHGVRLVLLWFGTWKNGSGHYVPQWMKVDEAQFPHVIDSNGHAVDSLSPHSGATLQADKLAFKALMRHLKLKDSQRTVILVQVENEPGTYGAIRDHSQAAEKLFQQDVPAAILTATGRTRGGSWSQVFGEVADGFFHSWAIARYIDEVAAAGSEEYALPMYVNVALRDPINPGKQGSWESGGATDDVLDIWKSAAPHIALLAPDIYFPDYAKYTRLLNLYHRSDNALLVPETGRSPEFARFCFASIGQGALGWAPFGLDQTSDYEAAPADVGGAARLDASALTQLTYNFAVLRPIDRLIAALQFQGKVKGVAQASSGANNVDRLDFGSWTAAVSYGRPHFGNSQRTASDAPPVGEALVARLGPDDFLVTAYQARVDFESKSLGNKLHRQFLSVEEGTYVNGVWTQSRIWNGDQTDYGLNFATVPRLLRVRLATY